MARITITDTGPTIPSSIDEMVDIAVIIDRHGKVAVDVLRVKIWGVARFVYAGIKPRPNKSKSGEAWTSETGVTAKGLSYSLTLYNSARNRYGTAYVPYVHLAGTPRSNVLTLEVDEYMETTAIPAILRELDQKVGAFVGTVTKKAASYG